MSSIVFTNANLLLDGHAQLQKSLNVLVNDNYIDTVTSALIDVGRNSY